MGIKSLATDAAASSGVGGDSVHADHSASLHSHGGPLFQSVDDCNNLAVIPLVKKSAGLSSVGQ